ncbi:MAG: ABC transporter ATP-binding protein [Actinobacteria bacterium]|nr:ABC transporter ATP-binding protein [Actinomycetota bacterium]
MTTSIVAKGVGIRFLFDHERRVVTPALSRLRRRGSETWGLRDVDLALRGGEGVALLGASGSGKTTFLRTLGGIYYPDVGTLSISGRVASLLSVDAGLLTLLTGRENALLLMVLAGHSRRRARGELDAVAERSRLGESFDRPVSSYSQGMRARLGFAVADRSDPDVLLLDEVHEALDHEFREIVRGRAQEIVSDGGIVVAAGHDHPLLEQICTQAVFFARGVVQAVGPFDEVRDAYLARV